MVATEGRIVWLSLRVHPDHFVYHDHPVCKPDNARYPRIRTVVEDMKANEIPRCHHCEAADA